MAARLLGLGDNTVDTYVDLGQQFPGGNAVNVAVLARRLGAEAGYLGCLGKDGAGDLLRGALDAEGVERSRCRNVAGHNARAFISHNAGDRQFIRSSPGVRGAWTAFGAEDLDYIGGFDLVHSSIFSELADHLEALRPAVRRWSFDFSERWTPAYLNEVAPRLDAVFLSHPKASDEDCLALARWCAAFGPRLVAVTRGAKGAMVLIDGVAATRAPEPTEIVDTLGAGDAFIAACLLADHAGQSAAAALEAGMRAAAEACGRLGAFGHGRPWSGVTETVHNNNAVASQELL